MLRHNSLAIAVSILAASQAFAAILPEQFGEYRRQQVQSPGLKSEDQPIWSEYALREAEQAPYTAPGRTVVITAYRFEDTTGAYAAFLWQRPASSTRSKLSEVAVDAPGGAAAAVGNYLLRFEGAVPDKEAFDLLVAKLPGLVRSSLPTLGNYIPRRQRIAGSERHILGPTSLAVFAPAISAASAGFEMGAEAEVASFRLDGREAQLVIFSYPTPHIARARLENFQNLPDVVAVRDGPLISAVVRAPDKAAAERLLSSITYQAKVSWSEEVPEPRKDEGNPGDMLLAIVLLAAGLMVASVLVGFFLGSFRQVLSRFGLSSARDGFTALDLSKR
ncbi:MAG: DUF6599 family protein [Bryobacteraceae bacterium]